MSTKSFDIGVQLHREEGELFDCACGTSHDDAQNFRAAQRIDLVVEHMQRNVDKPVRVSTLSAVAGVSASHFFSQFKSVMGQAPIEYFIRLKMKRACELLRQSDLMVKEIAGSLGYSDPFHFSRMFRVVTGCSPSEYRSQGEISSDSTASPDRNDLGNGWRNWATVSSISLPQNHANCAASRATKNASGRTELRAV